MIPLGVLASARVAAGGGLPAADYGFGFLQAAAYPGTTKLYTHTFAGQSLGDPCEGRTIIIAVVTQVTLGSITIAGETVAIDANDPGMYGTRTVVGHVTVPSGTSGDVVVNLSAAPHDRVAIALWRHGGPVTLASADTVTPLSLPVTAGDHVVAARYVAGVGTWGGGVTSNGRPAFPSGDAGHFASMTAASSTTLSITLSATGFAFAGAAYTPA